MLKKLIKIIFVLVLALIIASVLLLSDDSDAEKMIEKYGQNAQKVEDGVGGWIYYRDQGSKDAPALLLIHGSRASMQTWNSLIAKLAKDFRLISFDQHGHGLTGPHSKNDYSAAANIETATRVLDATGLKDAIWVGNSMGGWVAWRAALEVPNRVSGLVLLDASEAQDVEEVEPYLAAKLASSPIGQIFATYFTPRFLVKKSIKQNYADPSKVSDAIIDQYWELIRFPGNRQAIGPVATADREPEKWQQIGKISVPTLILWGDQDSVMPVSHASAFHAKINNSELITYPNVGHLPMEEAPDLVAKDILNWYNR